jgi:sulfonate transport system substrate-binding protein
MRLRITFKKLIAAAIASAAIAAPAAWAQAGPQTAPKPTEIRLDYATYNPLSLVLKERKILEESLAADKINVRWVLSLGSNKALEFLNAGGIDLGSTAGAAALLGAINGNPIKSVYVYSRPEWTALVTRANTAIAKVEDLKGKRIAVTRGTDPYIFLLQALAQKGLGEKDVTLVLLQHQDGRLALERGDVDAWAGLDPMMAQAEVGGAKLFHRDAALNTWGVLNARTAFAKEQPELVGKVVAAYEQARVWAKANPAELAKLLETYAKIDAPVAALQITRTDLRGGAIGAPQLQTIEAAGLALQKAGVIDAKVDVKAVTAALIDSTFTGGLAGY